MHKTTLFILTVLLILGCAKPKVAFVDNSISRYITVEGAKERVVGKLKEVEVYGENKSGDHLKFRYRVVWKDKDGFEIPSLSSKWTDFSVYKNTPYQFSSIAPSAEAVDYMIYISK